ncbi:unnamed protein product, partial [Effrenium voratum]
EPERALAQGQSCGSAPAAGHSRLRGLPGAPQAAAGRQDRRQRRGASGPECLWPGM